MIGLAASRLSDAISAEIDAQGRNRIAQVVGVGKSTVHDRADDLARWPIIDIARWAEHSPIIRRAALDLIESTHRVAPDGRRVGEDARQALPALLTQAQSLAQALADGAVSPAEAQTIASLIPGLIDRLHRLATDAAQLARATR